MDDNTPRFRRFWHFATGVACIAALFGFGLSAPVSGAQVGSRSQSSSGFPADDALVTVVVSVRELGGGPLQGNAVVKLSSDVKGTHLTAVTRDAGNATFPSLHTGDYQIEVSSVGYKTKIEPAEVMPAYPSYNV